MSDLTITSRLPDSADSERLLLARLLAGPVSSVGLTSAARTVTTITTAQSSRGFSRLLIHWNVTAASGTGGLTLRFVAVDPISGVQTVLGNLPIITSTGSRCFAVGVGVGPASGASLGFFGTLAAPLPTSFQVQVQHADASSYTYALNCELIP